MKVKISTAVIHESLFLQNIWNQPTARFANWYSRKIQRNS